MFGFKLRQGRIFRTYDNDSFTVSLDAETYGGTFSPTVALYWRPKENGWMHNHGRGYYSRQVVRIPVPVLSFARAYRFRRFGTLRLYGWQGQAIYKAFKSPKR